MKTTGFAGRDFLAETDYTPQEINTIFITMTYCDQKHCSCFSTTNHCGHATHLKQG
jgi:hypothetical protein